MTNNSIFKQIKGFFGKSIIIGFFLAVISVTSFAQTQTVALINRSNNGHEGYLSTYATQWQINWSSPGLITVIGQPCSVWSDNTWTCQTITYSNGRQIYKGEIQSFTSGVDFQMRNTERWNVNRWEREYNDGWTSYYVK